MLLPPYPEDAHAGLAKEIKDRRAAGATTSLVADEALLCAAKGSGLLEEGAPKEGACNRRYRYAGLGGGGGYCVLYCICSAIEAFSWTRVRCYCCSGIGDGGYDAIS